LSEYKEQQDFSASGSAESPHVLHVHMLGDLTFAYEDRKIDCLSNRSKLIWTILAYLIYNRGKLVRTEELISIAGNSSKNVNPSNAMRTAIFRARQMLDELVGNTEHTFLISQNGGYMWKPDIPTVIDFVEFEGLMAELEDHPDDYKRMLAAFWLYDGRFLSLQSSELWVIPLQTYYHKLYETLLGRMLPVLEKDKKYFDAICVCRKTLLLDPFVERNYRNLMRFLLLNNEREEVIKVYKDLSKMLMSGFGALPDQDSRALYCEALSTCPSEPLLPEEVMCLLDEQEQVRGALVCDYDFFKILYQAHARSIERTGIAIHTAVVSLKSDGKGGGRNDLSHAMDLLEQTMRTSLRRGDVITRCSASQFIVMLLSADLENSRKVCERFIAAFKSNYQNSHYWIEYSVYPVRTGARS
jgi:DNA-binding SARP family transcriptional activator